MKMSLIARRAGLLVLAVTLDAAIIQSSAFSQSLSNQQARPDASTGGTAQGNTLTGGAEGAPTGQATPGRSSNTGMPSSVSGGSNAKGNTLTAEQKLHQRIRQRLRQQLGQRLPVRLLGRRTRRQI